MTEQTNITVGEPYPEEREELGSQEIGFWANFPDIQSAINIGGDGGRIKLDIPETEMVALVKLAAYGRGKRLRVRIEIEEEG